MKSIIEQIGGLDKQTCKDLRAIMDMSYDTAREVAVDEAEQERIMAIIDSISSAAKARIKELSLYEIENNK